MASSATRAFAPEIAELCEEAFERCGIDPGRLTDQMLESARRSLNLLFVEWENDSVTEFLISQTTKSTAEGLISWASDAGTLDVLSAFIRRDGIDVPMMRIGRDDYNAIPDKDEEGRPDRFYPERAANGTITVYIWPAGENATDVIYYDRLMATEDASAAAQTPGLPRQWWEAIAAGWAGKLALKWAPRRFGGLKAEAAMALKNAKIGTRDKADTSFGVQLG